jgi:hypothetical protein
MEIKFLLQLKKQDNSRRINKKKGRKLKDEENFVQEEISLEYKIQLVLYSVGCNFNYSFDVT